MPDEAAPKGDSVDREKVEKADVEKSYPKDLAFGCAELLCDEGGACDVVCALPNVVAIVSSEALSVVVLGYVGVSNK